MAEFVDINKMFKDSLEVFLNELKDEQLAIFDADNMNATGQTRATFAVKMEESRGILLGPDTLTFLERGRGPTNNAGGSGTPLIDQIKIWIAAKRIVPVDITLDSLAFLITRKIHREGTKRFRDNQRSGIIDKVLAPSKLNKWFLETTELIGVEINKKISSK